MSRIFISYRREDTLLYADRLQEDLGEHYGADEIFRDMDTIEPGIDFVNAIDRALRQTEIMLVLIGPDWIGPESRQRLHQAGDYVRIEIAAGLRRSNVRVIPVLVGGAMMPPARQLPEDIRALSRRNAFELMDSRWRTDRAELLRQLDRVLETKANAHQRAARRLDTADRLRRLRKPAVIAAAVLAAALGAVLLFVLLRDESPGEVTTAAQPTGTVATQTVGPGELAWGRADASSLGGSGDQHMTSIVNPLRGGAPAFVAVGYDGPAGDRDAAVWTSPDGSDWTRVEDGLGGGGDQVLNGVAFVQAQETLVAGGTTESGGDKDAALWESANGARWRAVGGLGEPGTDEAINSVNGTRLGLVAAGSRTGDGEDGAIWIDPPGAAPFRVSEGLDGRGDQRVNRVVQLQDGSFVAVGFDAGDAGVWLSEDGESWSGSRAPALRVAGAEEEIVDAVVVGGSRIVAVGRAGNRGAVWESPNGVGWSLVATRPGVFEASGGSVRLLRVVASEDAARTAGAPRFLAGGVAGEEPAGWTSSNGTTWRREPDSEGELEGAAGGIEGLTAKRLPAIAVGWSGGDAAVWLGFKPDS